MDPLVWYDLFLFLVLLVLFIYVFATVRITNLHKVYFIFHFFMMLWPLCQMATDLAHDLWLQLLYVTLSFVALSFLGGGWLLLTLFLAGHVGRLGPRRACLLFVPALIAAVGVVWNPNYLFVIPLKGGYIEREYGPWFWVVIAILVGYLLSSLFVLFRTLLSPSTSVTNKIQVKIMLWGILVLAAFACIDALLNVVLSEWLPIIPGFTSLGIVLSDLFFIYVIKKYNMFDLVSIAHEDVINTIPYGILVLDDREFIIEVNKALPFFIELHVGDYLDMEALLGSVRVEGGSEKFLDHYKQRDHAMSQIEIIVERDSVRHFILQASTIVDSYGMPMGRILTFQDVSQERFLVEEMNRKNRMLQERNHSLDRTRLELSRANRQLEELVLTDSLTDCYNRRYLTQHLTHEVISNIQYRIPFSLILFDIDFFKYINDHYGHVIGDEVLYRTAQIVKESIRSTDILARYGGEEFMIYLPHTERQLAEQLGELVRLSAESNHIVVEHDREPVSITISMGILSVEDFEEERVPDHPEEYLIQLFAAVDKALYQAKQNGRNRIELASFQRASFNN